jgi:hypothetical protein
VAMFFVGGAVFEWTWPYFLGFRPIFSIKINIFLLMDEEIFCLHFFKYTNTQ